ncbi:MAG: hypothetical protein IPK94_07365 [Saprospiraceae bacterium]|nr:hypothetical protein [Saprospiraceae bacterium]
MYNVPFRLHIERDIGISRVKAEGAMRIFFNTDYSILEDWRFETTTTIISHEWIETPKSQAWDHQHTHRTYCRQNNESKCKHRLQKY